MSGTNIMRVHIGNSVTDISNINTLITFKNRYKSGCTKKAAIYFEERKKTTKKMWLF